MSDQLATVDSLQQRIYERAKKKLNAVLKVNFNDHLANLEFAAVVQLVGPLCNWKLESIYGLKNVQTHLFDKHIGQYVQVETDLFLAEIDRLKSEVGNINERLDEVIQ